MDRPTYYFTTRDLLLMAALAALGGIAGTYINALGDAVQSVLGFVGTTQWAAGLHVLWLTLAVGLTGKLGAGTLTGVLKGGVELLTGNTHGVLVVLVDLVAGVLVDTSMLPFQRKDKLAPFVVAGGLAAASNVFAFQLFASLPADVLAYGALALIGLVAGASGMLFAGVFGFGLLNNLRRSGVVKDRPPTAIHRRAWVLFLLLAVSVVTGLMVYLRQALRGPESVVVHGAVSNPFVFPDDFNSIEEVTQRAALRGVEASYSGYPLAALLDHANPDPHASTVLLRASDGYSFFLSMTEVNENDSILLAPQVEDDEASFNIVGPQNSKAWVRGIKELVLIGSSTLPLEGMLESPGSFDPNEWQYDMDSATLDLSSGKAKVQGVTLGTVIASVHPKAEASQVVIYTNDGELSFDLDPVLFDDTLRLFSLVEADAIRFVLGRMNGEVVGEDVVRIEVR